MMASPITGNTHGLIYGLNDRSPMRESVFAAIRIYWLSL